MTCGINPCRNSSFINPYACAYRNQNKCTTPIEVLRKISRLQCGNDVNQNIYGPNNIGTFEDLDWQFDQLYNGRQVTSCPCERCPVFSCACRRVNVRNIRRCKKTKCNRR